MGDLMKFLAPKPVEVELTRGEEKISIPVKVLTSGDIETINAHVKEPVVPLGEDKTPDYDNPEYTRQAQAAEQKRRYLYAVFAIGMDYFDEHENIGDDLDLAIEIIREFSPMELGKIASVATTGSVVDQQAIEEKRKQLDPTESTSTPPSQEEKTD